MHRVQGPKLHNHEESEANDEAVGVQEILPKVPQTRDAPRDEIAVCRGIVLADSTAVSKTVRSGSNPDTPATDELKYR